MKNIIILITAFLSWAAFDPELVRRRRAVQNNSEISSFREEAETQQEKQVRRQNLEVIPLKLRRRKPKLRSKCKYQGTKSRDRRDSNQRMIRRKFNNM